MFLSRLFHRLPPYVINGISVAIGVALIQLVVATLGGAQAALVASSGAICASLADLPLAPGRTWRRVLTAAGVACLAGLVTELLRPYPLVLGGGVALLAFVSNLALAWGLRAGPISFVGILAFIFTMASDPTESVAQLAHHVGWMAAGAGLYLLWSLLTSMLLQRPYRVLALAAALDAVAELLRSRAVLLKETTPASEGTDALRTWIQDEIQLDERLQAARDLLFVAPEDPTGQRHTALLVLAIDMRDTLLASALDIDLLRSDAAGVAVRTTLAAHLAAVAGDIDAIEEALRYGRPLLAPAARSDADAVAASIDFPAGDVRARLVPTLRRRLHHMAADVARMRALLLEGPVRFPLARDELQLFVSVEGWPLAALRPHLSLRSPVFRHAIRAGIALGTAYFIGIALPWASHPFWLVLSVGVVLRGNLEQTLARRNGRVIGTALGCIVVLGLSYLKAPWLSTVVFIAAVGVAHAFVTTRYLVTAAAASVMALLQAYLANPMAGFAVPERLADTILGALLAWAFSYVLPSWEKRAIPRFVARVLKSLDELATQVLRWPEGGSAEVALRLARREVYEALGAVAGAAQRTSVEPERVRLPLDRLAALLTHSYALLAHLAAIRILLARRAGELDRGDAEAALRAAQADIDRLLASERSSGTHAPGATDAEAPEPPTELAADALSPWLHRRLTLAGQAAMRVADVAQVLRRAASR
ncbi:MAG: FUSC family membrane protein [Betaproteobacteria bacterium]